jgi:glycerol-3-phosphate acyltransferase PlsY
MNIFYSFLIGYLVGSFPTAFIILKHYKNIDIRSAGSGNVGTLNSFKVSKSKWIGLSVFIIDLLKGLVSVVLVKILIGNEFIFLMIALNAAVLAHCFSPWINFKGGRGLATAGGGSLIISLPILLIWLLIWLVTFIFPRNIHLANISATLFTAIFSFTSDILMNRFSSPHASNNLEFGFLVGTLMLIILVKHYIPLKELILNANNKN